MSGIQTSHAVANATALLPMLRRLEQHEKLYLIQFLVAELSRQQQGFFLPETVFAVWSPYDAFDAAETMMQAIKKRQEQVINHTN